MLSPERLALPDYEYLAQRHVLTYMEDAVCQLLENKEDISQYGIARFFTEYFNSVCQGTHILFREFSFIQATPHNRASFLRAFWRCFRTVGKNGAFSAISRPSRKEIRRLLLKSFPNEHWVLYGNQFDNKFHILEKKTNKKNKINKIVPKLKKN
uniref:Centriolar satellite-associated tubulin polyglutamylase complex regulator 1 n=1 Tax=Felis catus TaxID=9685 RepID=A0ABI7YGF3_FELCA